jgi:beta-glucosidase
MPHAKLMIGFSNSMFQASGPLGDSNWTAAAERGTVPPFNQPKSHWSIFEKDLDLMQKIGIKCYRISFEWSHIEPEKGRLDYAVLRRYRHFIEACYKRGIEPMITLYHFNEPLWFTQRGGFEKEENIQYFVDHCKLVFSLFAPIVSLWCTINEPAIQAFMGYWVGEFPPHVRGNFTKTVTVLRNLLKAHVEVYDALKNLMYGKDCQIGIVHSVFKFKPLYFFDPIAQATCHLLNPMTNDLVIKFFKTGRLDYPMMFYPGVYYHEPRATNSNDFIGLNFYANLVLGPNCSNFYGPTHYQGQEMGDMSLPLDPSGLSNAIDEIKQLNKPIYITEMGIADKNDSLRKKFLSSYFNVIRKKLCEGVDIRGAFLWTFADNYEWGMGNTKSFGFFDAHRHHRKSVNKLKKIIQQFDEHTAVPSEIPNETELAL